MKHYGTADMETVCLFEHYARSDRVKDPFRKNNLFYIFYEATPIIALIFCTLKWYSL